MSTCVCSTDVTKADFQEVKKDLLSPRILPLMWLGSSEKLIKFLVKYSGGTYIKGHN